MLFLNRLHLFLGILLSVVALSFYISFSIITFPPFLQSGIKSVWFNTLYRSYLFSFYAEVVSLIKHLVHTDIKITCWTLDVCPPGVLFFLALFLVSITPALKQSTTFASVCCEVLVICCGEETWPPCWLRRTVRDGGRKEVGRTCV